MQQEHNHNHADISTARLEAFSDGVLAIIITITVLELKVPAGNSIRDIHPLLPLLFTYLISFQTVGTYWNNHHHLLRIAEHVSAGIMWANLHLLFWLSLIPFASGWLGQNHRGTWPTALYAAILLMCGFAYQILQFQVLKHSNKRYELLEEFRKHPKGWLSLISYCLAIASAFFFPTVSDACIIFVAIVWFIPDRRVEKFL